MGKIIFVLSTVGCCILLCLANTFKIHYKPIEMPYLYPIWICSVFLLIISTFKTKKRIIFKPYIWLVSFIICIYSYCCWKNFEQSKVIESTFSEPSTIIFITILSYFFLGTGISRMQISALFVITGGVIFPIFCSHGLSNIDITIVFKHILTNFLFSCVNIIYEIKIKPFVETIWDFLFTSSLAIFGLSSFFMIVNHILVAKKKIDFIFNYTNTLLCILETYSIIYNFVMVFQFLPVARTILKLFLSTLSGLIEGIFLIHSVKAFDVFSFLIISLGVVLYNMKEIKILITTRFGKKKKLKNQINITQKGNDTLNETCLVYQHNLEDTSSNPSENVKIPELRAIEADDYQVGPPQFTSINICDLNSRSGSQK